jgi:glycosyltransferase involved in cell wall biosynthesis
MLTTPRHDHQQVDADRDLPRGAHHPTTSRLTLVTVSAAEPMGQQAYEGQLMDRAAAALGSGWSVEQMAVRTLRSSLPGSNRIPSRLLSGRDPELRRAYGRLLYHGLDVIHRLDLRLPPAPRREVLTIHDLVQWRYDDEGSPPMDAEITARRAEKVICPSQFAADEIASMLGVADPVPIHNGVDERFFGATPLSESELAALGVRRPYVLHAGGATRRKNLAGLAAAWPKVRTAHPEVTLVLMGPPDWRRNENFEGVDGALRIGKADHHAVAGIMAAAEAVVVPSTYEGFGLPALEAMAAGVPVVAAARSALPEVCGDAAFLVEPDPAGLAEGLIAALSGGADVAGLIERGRQRAAQFTWESSAAAHAEVWRSCTD